MTYLDFLFFFSFSLKYVIRKVQHNREGMELNDLDQIKQLCTCTRVTTERRELPLSTPSLFLLTADLCTACC